jgi:hypothetical protein
MSVNSEHFSFIMSSRVRKYDSGCEKHKNKRFVVKDQSTTRNPTTENDAANGSNGVEAHTSEINVAPNSGERHTCGIDEIEENANDVDATLNGSATVESDDDLSVSFQLDISDPRYWDSLNQNRIDILLLKGPKRDLSIQKGPKDKFSIRFSVAHYTRILSKKRSMIEICWYIAKSLIEYFVFVVSY